MTPGRSTPAFEDFAGQLGHQGAVCAVLKALKENGGRAFHSGCVPDVPHATARAGFAELDRIAVRAGAADVDLATLDPAIHDESSDMHVPPLYRPRAFPRPVGLVLPLGRSQHSLEPGVTTGSLVAFKDAVAQTCTSSLPCCRVSRGPNARARLEVGLPTDARVCRVGCPRNP